MAALRKKGAGEMTVEKKKDGNKLTVTITGQVDRNTAPKLKEELLSGALEGVQELYFDLGGMDYTSSVGLRVFLDAYKEIGEDGRMVLMHLKDEVKEIFDLTGFTDFLEIEE